MLDENGTHSARSSVQASLLSPPFLLSALIMVGASIGLRPGIAMLALRYQKQTVPLRVSFRQFDPSDLPSFEEPQTDAGFTFNLVPEFAGTDEVVVLPLREKGQFASNAANQMCLVLTYYSNPRDKVPHVPDICYGQTGTEIKERSVIDINAPDLESEHGELRPRLLRINQNGKTGVLAYVFVVNGEFAYGREQVRWRLGLPGDRYSYFCKVDVVAHAPPGTNEKLVVDRCKRLMYETISVLIRKYLPDDKALRNR